MSTEGRVGARGNKVISTPPAFQNPKERRQVEEEGSSLLSTGCVYFRPWAALASS